MFCLYNKEIISKILKCQTIRYVANNNSKNLAIIKNYIINSKSYNIIYIIEFKITIGKIKKKMKIAYVKKYKKVT